MKWLQSVTHHSANVDDEGNLGIQRETELIDANDEMMAKEEPNENLNNDEINDVNNIGQVSDNFPIWKLLTRIQMRTTIMMSKISCSFQILTLLSMS